MSNNVLVTVLCICLSTSSIFAQDWLKIMGFEQLSSNSTINTKISLKIFISSEYQRDVRITSCEFKQLHTYEAVRFSSNLTGKEIQSFSTISEKVDLEFLHNVGVRGCIILTLNDGVSQHRQLVPISVNVTMPPDKQAYAYTDNLEYDTLYSALQAKVINHTSLGYKNGREVMFGKADNINDTVECIYTGRKLRTLGIPPNGEFNTEHTWVQSRGSSNEPNRSDINHLYPTFPNANSIRANYPFGNVATLWRDAGGGSRLGFTATGDTVFEPRSVSKGNIARSIFYYLVRYGNVTGYYNSPYYMDTPLRQWNKLDPPDDRERRRADTITAYQGKRNPFVDFPVFVERLNFLGPAPTPFFGSILKEMCIRTNFIADTIRTLVYNGTNTNRRIKSVNPLPNQFRLETPNDIVFPAKGFQELVLSVQTSTPPDFTYFIVEYDNGVVDSIALRVCGVSTVSEMERNQSLKVEVNPHPIDEDSEIRLDVPASEIRKVTLYSLEGRELMDISNRVALGATPASTNLTGTRISLSNLQIVSGVVMVKIQTTSGIVSRILLMK
jgi:deoxyribonuclease I